MLINIKYQFYNLKAINTLKSGNDGSGDVILAWVRYRDVKRKTLTAPPRQLLRDVFVRETDKGELDLN